ncbi:MAG: hypothetical protein ABFS23_08415 [Pseudomonadota bacterium]
MTNYVVTYVLSQAAENYVGLFESLAGFESHSRIMPQTWIVRDGRSAAEIRARLSTHLKPNDLLFVGEIGANCAWHGVSGEESQWIGNLVSPPAS